MKLKNKKINLAIIVTLITLVIIFLYPVSSKLLKIIRSHLYVYGYSLPKNFVIEDTSKLPAAQAVPILMYHGVIEKGPLGDNTERKVFISQMEMLKQKGYQTISIKEYDLFRQGKFILPPKPIIITFDDGRKDSFYTVDEVLKKLGFKATIFITTIKANENEPFYLSWSELTIMRDTGRWEIEAHGRRSHEEVIVDENNNIGRYYTSRIYILGKGLESIDDYKRRVEDDYINGISDIKEHLGIDVQYFAVPLSSYGIYDNSNYEYAYEFNQELTSRFFKLAFVQAQQRDGVGQESFYNYQSSNSHINLKRFEVKNSSSVNLLELLEHFSPKPADLIFPGTVTPEKFLENTWLLYGSLNMSNNRITLSSNSSNPSARILFGDSGWKNYSIKAKVVHEKGRSVSLIVCYSDEDNFIFLNWGDKLISLVERVGGEEHELSSYYPWIKDGEGEVLIRVFDGYITAYFNGILLARGLPTNLSRGAAGFSVWDSKGAQSTINSLEIKDISLDSKQADSKPKNILNSVTSSNNLNQDITISIDKNINKNSTSTLTTEIPGLISTSQLLPLYFSNNFDMSNWEKIWGDFSIVDGIINIGTTTPNIGGGVFLKKSKSWANYILKAKLNWLGGSGVFSILSRYQDSDNYFACSYTKYGGGASLVQVIDGKATTLAENYSLQIPYFVPWLDLNFGMEVNNNHIECLINNEWVLKSDTKNIIKEGVIGFERWDSKHTNSSIQINNVVVTPL